MTKLLAAALTLALAAAPANPDKELASTSAQIKTSVNKILKTLKNEALSLDEKKSRVMKIMGPLFDLKLIARLVLGRKHWSGFSKEERKEFTDLFILQLQDSYFEKVDMLTDEEVEFGKAFWVKKKIHIPAYLLSKGDRYEIVYKLARRRTGWKVYDMEIEGISIVKSYGSQYSEFLREKTPAELLTKMREKNLGLPSDFEEKEKARKAKEEKEKAEKEAG